MIICLNKSHFRNEQNMTKKHDMYIKEFLLLLNI